jgi:hypothetical protein
VTAQEPSDRPRDRLARVIRRLLWLDDASRRTDSSRANRGFYVGGPAVGWRFVLPVVVVGIVIVLVIRALGLVPI